MLETLASSVEQFADVDGQIVLLALFRRFVLFPLDLLVNIFDTKPGIFCIFKAGGHDRERYRGIFREPMLNNCE